MTDRAFTDQLTAAAVPIGAASALVRSARMAPTDVQLDAAAAALEELDVARSILKDVLGK